MTKIPWQKQFGEVVRKALFLLTVLGPVHHSREVTLAEAWGSCSPHICNPVQNKECAHGCLQIALSYSVLSDAHEMVPPTFRVALSSSVIPIKKNLMPTGQSEVDNSSARFSFWMILDCVKMTDNTDDHRDLNSLQCCQVFSEGGFG